jgi:hypothetical protein
VLRVTVGSSQVLVNIACVGLGRYVSPIWTKPVPGSRLVELDPDPLRVTPFMGAYGNVLHEIAHAMECEEEYGFGQGDIPAGRADTSRRGGNVVPQNVLLLDPTNPTNKTDFHLDNALWGFSHRIRAAGVLASSPDPANQRIQLRPGHGKLFSGLKDGDPLFLRARPLLGAMEFEDTLGTRRGNARFLLTRSNLFQFKKISGPTEPDVIIVEGLQSAVTTWQVPGRAGLDPILYSPKQDSTGSRFLTSPFIRAHIESTDLPLNRKQGTCQPFDPAKAGKILREKTVPTNLPAGIVNDGSRDVFLSHIVGLMDRGAGYSCAIFHPTGSCIMDLTNDPVINAPKKAFEGAIGGISGYCHVCRYVLVDYLDPRLHGELDKLYPEVP